MKLLLAILAAAGAGKSAPAPDVDALLRKEMPSGQVLVQTLRADLDGDGRQEWIAIGEPARVSDHGNVSITIFREVKGKPQLAFRQVFQAPNIRRAGAVVRQVPPVGRVVVLVGADPDPGSGDSTFALQLYGFRDRRYQPLIYAPPRFPSQGGFVIEDRKADAPGHEIVVWSYVQGAGEGVWDEHQYWLLVYRFENGRWAADDRPVYSEGRLPTWEAAASSFGITTRDLRRQIPRVAEVP